MKPDSIDALHPRFESERGLLILDLDHGKANEVGSAELDAFEALCERLESDESVRCLCTTSRRTSRSGKPIFIAGANVTEREGWDDERIKTHVHRQRGIMRRLRRLPLFSLAVTHGVTLGWGAEYLLTADYVIATPTASFGLPETGLGIIPGARGTAELAALVGPAHALRLGCTGEVIDASEALRIGLIQEMAGDLEQALLRVRTIADAIGKRSPSAVALFKEALLDGLGADERERLRLEAHAYERCVDLGEASIGRASFSAIRAGASPAWGRRFR